jgi:CTD small phosphatase-like protein 2
MIDKNNTWVKYKLYRQHTVPIGPAFIKDLSKLGRDLAKTIIVDNVAENYQLQQENGILIKSWITDPNDRALIKLAPLLEEIVMKKVPDVRVALNSYKEQLSVQQAKGIKEFQFSLK